MTDDEAAAVAVSLRELEGKVKSLTETLQNERKEFFDELAKLRNELAVARKALHQIHLIAAAEC